MKFPEPIAIKTIAERFNLKIIGDADLIATGINEIHKVEEGDITFSDVKKYFKKSLNSAATIIILNEEAECPEGKAIMIAENPFEVYNQLVKDHRPLRPLSANIDENSQIHPSTVLEPGVIIGPNVKIGKYCHIMANAIICEHTIIGDHVTIQHGSVIGSDGFYYKRTPEGHTKWRHGGRVLIEDHVEVGSLCTINKGVSGDTIIGEGTKLDCQVHVGHGAVIGKHCLFAAGVAIGGKSIIGDHVTLYGMVGVVHDVSIGSNTTVHAKSLIARSIEGGKSYNGIPVSEAMHFNRLVLADKKLPELLRKLEKL